MAVSFHKFIERLNRSGLLTTGELQSLLAAAPGSERPGDAEALARWLVKQGHLTPFQAKAVYLGHTRGLVIGNYVILDLLGVGGMGQVYKAQHRRMKRIVALKLLSPEVAEKPELVSRFHQEVEAAARLMHPNIVTAFDADEADGKHFLVMEYVPGRDLASLVRERGRLSVDRSIRCVLDAARGLEYAHKHGVVHRDVKPSNLLLAAAEGDAGSKDAPAALVKILDMGLARIEAQAENLQQPSELTRTGIVMGTVDYMSPEQALNTHDADHRSDIYSLGITLHYLITGKVPFTGRSVIEQVLAHREAKIPSLKAARSEVPSALDSIFAKMIAKQPQERYQSMSQVVAALEGALNSRESASDLPVMAASEEDDAALVGFLNSMSGDTAAQQRAAAAVITPSSSAFAGETLVAADRSTAVGRTSRLQRRRDRPVPWGPILLHASWSIALLVAAGWMLWVSRAEQDQDRTPANGRKQAAAAPAIKHKPDSAAIAVDSAAQEKFERALAEWVLARGGTVKVAATAQSETIAPGEKLPRWPFAVTVINLSGSTIAAGDMRRLAEVAKLRLLQMLALNGCTAVDDGWIASLKPCQRLRHVDVGGSPVTDKSLGALSRACEHLEVLRLASCDVDGSGLTELSRLPWLRELDLHDTRVDGQAFDALAGLTTLRDLDLRGTRMTAAQLDALREELSGCTILSDAADAP